MSQTSERSHKLSTRRCSLRPRLDRHGDDKSSWWVHTESSPAKTLPSACKSLREPDFGISLKKGADLCRPTLYTYIHRNTRVYFADKFLAIAFFERNVSNSLLIRTIPFQFFLGAIQSNTYYTMSVNIRAKSLTPLYQGVEGVQHSD